jgi:hypothetical protein
MLLITSKEDSYEPSCVLARVLVLVHSLSGTALSSFLALSWPSPLASGSEDVHHGPTSSQAALPPRLSNLSPRLHPLFGCEASAFPCPTLARGQKPPGSPEAGEYRGLRLSEPQVSLLRDHRRSRSCLGWRWHAWPC